MTGDQRRHSRLRSDLNVIVSRIGGPELFAGSVRNISKGGVFVEVKEFPEGTEILDTKVELEISTPKNARTSYRFTGIVVWSREVPSTRNTGTAPKPRGFGIQLLDLEPSEELVLDELLKGLDST